MDHEFPPLGLRREVADQEIAVGIQEETPLGKGDGAAPSNQHSGETCGHGDGSLFGIADLGLTASRPLCHHLSQCRQDFREGFPCQDSGTRMGDEDRDHPEICHRITDGIVDLVGHGNTVDPLRGINIIFLLKYHKDENIA